MQNIPKAYPLTRTPTPKKLSTPEFRVLTPKPLALNPY